ncbi:hypothetical protein Tco_1527698 [Tanacetum coccineum]
MSTSYANVTGKPSRKSVNCRTLIKSAGNEVDVVVPVESIRAISEWVNMDWLNQCFTRLPSYSHSSLALWMVWMECLKMVKLHGVPVMTFSEDGLIAIATELGTSLMLESYTTDMCMQSWVRSSYATTMIELRANEEFIGK